MEGIDRSRRTRSRCRVARQRQIPPGGRRFGQRLAAPAERGVWGTDWFGRAQAAVIYIFVNDFHEALYFIRGTDARNAFLFGRYHYTMTFPPGALPPVDRERGGFWSLTMYDQDYFMPATSPNGGTTSAPSTSTRTNWSSHRTDR